VKNKRVYGVKREKATKIELLVKKYYIVIYIAIFISG